MNPADKAIAYLRELVEEPPQHGPVEGRVLAFADGQGRILRYGSAYERTIAAQAPARLSRTQVLIRAVNELFSFEEMVCSESDADLREDFIYSAWTRLDLLREYVEEAEPEDRALLGAIWRQVQADRAAQAGARWYIQSIGTLDDGAELVELSLPYYCYELALAHLREGEHQKLVAFPANPDEAGVIRTYPPTGDKRP